MVSLAVPELSVVSCVDRLCAVPSVHRRDALIS